MARVQRVLSYTIVIPSNEGVTKGLREVAIQKRQTPLSSCKWNVQNPFHREVNARTDGYPCQMGSVQSLYGMTAELSITAV